MRRGGCVPLLVVLLLLALLPLAFGQLFAAALLKLRLSPDTAVLLVLGMLIGGGINIPVKRIPRTEPLVEDPLAIFGLLGYWPRLQRVRSETVIAVNVGGCLIPAGLALYETRYVLSGGGEALAGLAIAVVVNVAVCYRLAQPLPNIGIALPGFIPPLVAALSALIFVPAQAVPVAFIAGVVGPLVGADLLHLRDIARIATGTASIGGAGTFDGIVLSGIVAAYLA